MNKKKTNRIVAIFNIIFIIAFYVLFFSSDYLETGIMSGGNGHKSIYNSFIIDTLMNNVQIISILMFSGIGIINIICSIQNKKNKKICFWQLVFAICCIWTGLKILISFTAIDEYIVEWINRIIFSIIPIILALINIVLIKKHKVKVIQVISYIAVIILSILSLFEIISTYWQIIAVVMQLIYIHFQDKDIEESKSRKIINIILYYILQFILAVGFLLMVLFSLLITKVNTDKWENELTKLYNNIPAMQGIKNSELYIPVERNYKYGFISENGEEKIPCEYDKVSLFNEIEIDNTKYYFALAKKDSQYYILSKNNDILSIASNLEEILQTAYDFLEDEQINIMNKNGDYRVGYLQCFEFLSMLMNVQKNQNINEQTLQANGETKKISLTERNSKYYYNTANFSMLIEPIYDGSDEEEEYFNDYNGNGYYYDEDEDTFHISSYKTKYKVSILKPNEETKTSIVYLPGIDTDDSTLETYTNGFIAFENEDNTRVGWYDLNGNQTTISNKYGVMDIKDNKIILMDLMDEDEIYDENTKYEPNFLIVDLTGKILLQTTALDVYDNSYLVKINNKKMVLMDSNLNIISNEYDKIITNMSIDVSSNYCSYY